MFPKELWEECIECGEKIDLRCQFYTDENGDATCDACLIEEYGEEVARRLKEDE